MALTAFQRSVCRLIAAQRRRSGASYVAGGVALNEAIGADRISRDIDLFHDTVSAVSSNWIADRALLENDGCVVSLVREREGFVEASIRKGSERVLMQWAADSAFRFFPLVEHDDFGLTLHPFDLATNKVLALVGRLEPRDWIDVIQCHARIQRLGCLAWAASGKDPGFSPVAILAEAGRSSRYSAAEIAPLIFAGPPPDAALLSREWRAMLEEGRELVGALPAAESGKCIFDSDGSLFRGGMRELRTALKNGELRFHSGSIRGALPCIAPA